MNSRSRQYICNSILKITKALSLLFFVAISAMAVGQTDSTKKNQNKIRPVFISVQDFETLNHKLQAFDTSLNGFHQLNPYRKHNQANQDLGLIGTPIQPLFLNTTKQAGFDLGFNRMNTWMYNTNGGDEKIIISPSPYTKLNYSQGEKELVFLEVLHTQNFTPRWNAGIDYRRLKTNNYLFFNLDGDAYNKIRLPSIYNLKLFTSYRSKSDKYFLLANITYNKTTLRETGGLSNPLSFDTTSGKRRVFDNPLVNASNYINQPAVFVKNYYRFGKTSLITNKRDSNTIDTLGLDFAPKGYFYHTFHASRSIFKYKDPLADTPHYKSHFTEGINDSMVMKEMTNAVGMVVKTTYKQFSNLIKASAEYSNYGIFNNFTGQNAFYNLSLNGMIKAALTSKFGEVELNGEGQIFMAGYNSKDYLLQAGTKLLIKNKFKLDAQFSSQRHVADFFQTIGFTSPIKWNQTLKPTYRNGLDASLEWIPWQLKAGFTASNFQNYNIYFFDTVPKGIDFNYLNIYVSNNLKFGKFTWHNRLSYQQISETFHLPKLFLSGGVFIENRFFKKNMLARIGVDYYWFSSYYADAYNPYIRQFVWQNTTKIGNYPYFDFYMSAQVQTMNLFIRFEHINQGISGNRYYTTPLYPNPPRFFRFGVNWRLFN